MLRLLTVSLRFDGMSSPSRTTPTFQFHANPLARGSPASVQQAASQMPPLLSLAAQSHQPPEEPVDSSSPLIPTQSQPQQHPSLSPIAGPTSPSLSFAIAPYRPASATPSSNTLAPQLHNSSSRASSGSGQRSASPQPPQLSHARKPTLARMSSMGDRSKDRVVAAPSADESDRAPLLGAQPASSHDLVPSMMSSDGMGKGGFATAAPIAAPIATATSVIGSNYYYEQYEATVNRIRARRAAESAAKEQHVPTPERTAREYKVVGFVFSLVLLAVSLLIYFLYPRVPLWMISDVRIDSLRLWSDGSASFAIETRVEISNSNFVLTGIESLDVSVSHNGTNIATGLDEEMTNIKWPPRANAQIMLMHDFSTLSADKFAGIFGELSRGGDEGHGGTLTLQYKASIVTSENFRLRNLQVYCTARLLIDPIPVPPKATIQDSQCEHTEQTG